MGVEEREDKLEKKKQLGLVFFPAFDWAISPDHPEREERLLYTRDQIAEEGLFDHPAIEEYRPSVASVQDIERVHISVPSVQEVITESHLIAAGGTIKAAELVDSGETKKAFALLRPPGHHAMRIVHGSRGFCTINIEAVAIEYLRKKHGGKFRCAIVDTDAHHADGTQDIYYNDPDILHICIHQDGRTLYPGTGAIEELGGPGAYGTTINLPLPPGSGDAELLYAVEHLALPLLQDFQPDLIINAAGQDNHFTDPLTNMNVTAQGYARMTELLSPDLVVLEGGYSIEGALPYVNVGLLLALAGLDYTGLVEPEMPRRLLKQRREVNEEVVRNVALLKEIWSNRKEQNLDQIFGKEEYFQRKSHIYYDTDNISEVQFEQILRCNLCSGYRIIYSTAGHQFGQTTKIAAVLIPWHACSQCRNRAEEAYQRLLQTSKLDFIYLQDPERERYLKK